jgi:hypothetical protein
VGGEVTPEQRGRIDHIVERCAIDILEKAETKKDKMAQIDFSVIRIKKMIDEILQVGKG